MSQAGRTRYFARSCLVLRARVALRAKYRVRPAWLIKRLSCRLLVFWHLRLAPSTCISFYLETNNFFSGLEYHPHAYPMKTITENASFQKRSPEWRFLNWRRLLVYLWTDDNVGFQIQSYDTSSWLLAWRMLNKGCYCISIVLAFSCTVGENDSNTLRVNAERKIFFFKNIRIRVDGVLMKSITCSNLLEPLLRFTIDP